MNQDIQSAKEVIERYFPNIPFRYMYAEHLLVGIGIGKDVTIEVVHQKIKTSVILSFEKDGKSHSTNIQYASEDHLKKSLEDSVNLLKNWFCFVDKVLSSYLQ